MKIGAQLYTIRQYCQTESDFRESMKRVADIGYTTVQLSGIGQIKPEVVRQICDDFGLTITLTHTRRDLWNNTEQVICDHKVYGCRYVGIGMGDEKYFMPSWQEKFSEDYLPVCRELDRNGMHFMYHTHCGEFSKAADGRLILSHLLEKLPPEICGITLDLYWLQFSGWDVMKMLELLQDRIPCVHLKDADVSMFQRKMVPVGEGNMDYAIIMDKLAEMGKTEYAYVEQDDCNGEDPFDCLRRSYEFLKPWDNK